MGAVSPSSIPKSPKSPKATAVSPKTDQWWLTELSKCMDDEEKERNQKMKKGDDIKKSLGIPPKSDSGSGSSDRRARGISQSPTTSSPSKRFKPEVQSSITSWVTNKSNAGPERAVEVEPKDTTIAATTATNTEAEVPTQVMETPTGSEEATQVDVTMTLPVPEPDQQQVAVSPAPASQTGNDSGAVAADVNDENMKETKQLEEDTGGGPGLDMEVDLDGGGLPGNHGDKDEAVSHETPAEQKFTIVVTPPPDPPARTPTLEHGPDANNANMPDKGSDAKVPGSSPVEVPPEPVKVKAEPAASFSPLRAPPLSTSPVKRIKEEPHSVSGACSSSPLTQRCRNRKIVNSLEESMLFWEDCLHELTDDERELLFDSMRADTISTAFSGFSNHLIEYNFANLGL